VTMDAEPFVKCHCTGVRRDQVLAAIRTGCRSVHDLRDATGVCSGCQTCWWDLETLLKEQAKRQDQPTGAFPALVDELPQADAAAPADEVRAKNEKSAQ